MPQLPDLPAPPIPFLLSSIIKIVIGIILLALFVRVIASFLRMDERYAFIRFLARITDPFIEPMRRIVKPVWRLDLSFFVAWFLLFTLEILLIQALPLGW
jgi:YggT family protein